MNKGVLLAVSTAFISGVSVFLNKFGVAGINPFLFAFIKNLLVGIFAFSIIMLLGNLKELRLLKKKDWMKLSLIGFVGGSIPFLLFFYALKTVSAINASAIQKTMFVWVAIMASTILKEKIDRNFLIGMLLLFSANLFFIDIRSFGIGELLILIATLMWSTELIISKRLLKNLSANSVVFGRMFFGSMFILAFLLATGKFTAITTITLQQAGWIGITSALLMGYVLTLYNALKIEKASIVASMLMLGSFVTIALNYTYIGTITVPEIASSLLLLCGMFFILKSQRADNRTRLIAKADTNQ